MIITSIKQILCLILHNYAMIIIIWDEILYLLIRIDFKLYRLLKPLVLHFLSMFIEATWYYFSDYNIVTTILNFKFI